MTKKVPLDRLRELAKHRSMRGPVAAPYETVEVLVASDPDILIWPLPRPDSFLPN